MMFFFIILQNGRLGQVENRAKIVSFLSTREKEYQNTKAGFKIKYYCFLHFEFG